MRTKSLMIAILLPLISLNLVFVLTARATTIKKIESSLQEGIGVEIYAHSSYYQGSGGGINASWIIINHNDYPVTAEQITDERYDESQQATWTFTWIPADYGITITIPAHGWMMHSSGYGYGTAFFVRTIPKFDDSSIAVPDYATLQQPSGYIQYPLPISNENSSIEANPTSVPADSVTPILLTATFLDSNGSPLPNREVTFSTNHSTDVISQSINYTDQNGQAFANLYSSEPGTREVQARDETDFTTLSDTAWVTFTEPNTPPNTIYDLIASTGAATGQVDLIWTAPGSDGSVGTATTYTVRYADSAITTELGWQSATDATGEPTPQPAGTPENMTVSGLTPGQTYYFAIRAEDEVGNISDLSNSPNAIAKEGADLGFRPNPDGYQFANPGFMQPTCLEFQNSYSGLSIQCVNNQPQQEYQALFRYYRSVFGTGICTGMAISSLLYYTSAEPHPQPGTIFELDFAQARPNMATYHGRQHSKAVLDIVVPSWNSWTDDSAVISQRVDEVYNQIKASLSSGNNNPLILDLFPRSSCGTSGHTIVPYRLDDTDPLHPKVYVYENFNPDNANKFMQFDFAASTHSFSYWLWDSTSCGTLVAIPVNTFTSSEGKIPGTQLHVSTGGNVEPLLTNSTGGMIGYNNGELTATVTNAMPVFPWHTLGTTSTVTSFLTPPDMYTTTLSSSGGGYTFTVWSLSGTLELQADGQTTPFTNSLLSTTNTDLISFDAGLHSAVLSTNDIQQSVTLKMSIPDTDNSQVYILENVNLLAGGNLTVDALDSELRLASNGILTNYDVYFDRVSTQTLSTFAHADLTLLANDKHFLTFSDGDDALLHIDHGGDGSIDETVLLENQADAFYKVYLPTILR